MANAQSENSSKTLDAAEKSLPSESRISSERYEIVEDDKASSQNHNNDVGHDSFEDTASLPRQAAVVVVIALAQITTQAGLTSTLSLLQVIGDHYHIKDPALLSWLIAGYSLTVGSFILISGRLGDVYGWKRMLVLGYSWFSLWTVVLGLSVYSNHVLFIFARVIQGIGPSICLPNALALLGAIYSPGKRKNTAFAYFGGNAPVGGVVGFVFGGLFDLTWYPWLYWVGSICLALIAILVALIVPDAQPNKPGTKGKYCLEVVWRLDLLAAAIGITALVLFNFAWNQAPIVGWHEPYVITMLILGVLLVPVFFYIELKVSTSPLIPFDVFTADNAFVLICLSSGWANFGIWIFFLVQILQILRAVSPLLLAAYLCPIAVSGMVAANICGQLLGRMRPAWVMSIALCSFVIGSSLVITLPPDQMYWKQIFVTSIIAPWGMNMSFPSATIIVSNCLKRSDQGVGASLVNTIVNYSISLGLGFAGTVLTYSVPVTNTKAQILLGYRCALYMGISLATLGAIVALIFVARSYRSDRKKARATAADDRDDD